MVRLYSIRHTVAEELVLISIADNDESPFRALFVGTWGIGVSPNLPPITLDGIQPRQNRVLDKVVGQPAIRTIMQFEHPDGGCGCVKQQEFRKCYRSNNSSLTTVRTMGNSN